ncbi:MAG: hypothetical protein MOIL_01147 [Candidatus Methanolliviera sp. GoM_oil]|nr:MAG: hypothetical protein MOIL_01147 [Candidatus Methanolliviera sp. GoM_oil]
MKRFILVLRSDKKNVLLHINHYCASCRKIEGVVWIRSLVNPEKGLIFCEWEAENEDDILKGIREVGITDEYEIVEVECIERCESCSSIFGEVE